MQPLDQIQQLQPTPRRHRIAVYSRIYVLLLLNKRACACTNTHNTHIIPRCRVVCVCVCVCERITKFWLETVRFWRAFPRNAALGRTCTPDNNATKDVPRSIVPAPPPPMACVCAYACEFRVIGDGTQLGKPTHYDLFIHDCRRARNTKK